MFLDLLWTLGLLRYLGAAEQAGRAEDEDQDEDGKGEDVFVLCAERAVGETDLATWFDGPGRITLDEEIIGLGKYGYTLTVLTSEGLPEDPLDEEDEDAELERSWTPRFAYGR